MEYANLFKKLEKTNPSKAYWIDMCRRNMLSLFDIPLWIGLIMGVIGIFISKIDSAWSMILFGGWALFAVAIVASAIINEKYRCKLVEELNK